MPGRRQGGTSPLTWTEIPVEDNEYSTPEGIAYDKEPFGSYFINGSVTVTPGGCAPVTMAPVVTSCPTGSIAVPIKVSNFNNVGGISLTLHYDPSILLYQSVDLNPAISGSFTNGTAPGVFILSYTCDPGISLGNNAILFTLHFGYAGPPAGGTSPLTWAEVPMEDNEYSTPDGIAYGKDPFGGYFINGSVKVDPQGCALSFR